MAIEISRREDPPAGRPTATTDGRIVYAVGDVHGCYELLIALLEAIADDMAGTSSGRRPLLVFLGDYIDRGPRSPEVLTTLIWLSRHAEFEVAFLRGNHEEMMLAFLHRPEDASAWLRVGGEETLRAYGVDMSDEQDAPSSCTALRDALMDRLPASHLAFLRSLELHAICGDYAFVHAGLRPGTALNEQSEDDLLWIRDEFLDARQPFEKIVVHGHSWSSDTPSVAAHRIGVDTGAYRTGTLTAVRLSGSGAVFIQARTSSD